MQINLPYQTHINKQKLDYILKFCNQSNNVNYAVSLTEDKAKAENQIYFVLYKTKIYLFCSLSRKQFLNDDSNNNETETIYTPLLNTWVELEDFTFSDDNVTASTDEFKVYLLNLKQLYSAISFSSDYAKRDIIQICVTEDELSFLLAPNLSTTLAVRDKQIVSDKNFISELKNFITFTSSMTKQQKDSNCYIKVKNPNKNSFLLPYFNHKNCLSFSVALSTNYAFLCKNGDDYNIITIKLDDSNKEEVLYYSLATLRKDKFDIQWQFSNNIIPISTGLWQLLVILQELKSWQELECYSNGDCGVFINGSLFAYHRCINYDIDEQVVNSIVTILQSFTKKKNNFTFVGTLEAEEIFLLNKLFPNSKCCYFDFSEQQFVGDTNIFQNKINKNNVIDFRTKLDDITIPLQITLTELKHYVGNDLSQKRFKLNIYTDGLNVRIVKIDDKNTANNAPTVEVVFNHYLSRKFLHV